MFLHFWNTYQWRRRDRIPLYIYIFTGFFCWSHSLITIISEFKRRKRHRRKHVENQEQCIMRGVYFKNMKWQAAIKVDKKQIHLGTVGSQEEAARLYDRYYFWLQKLSYWLLLQTNNLSFFANLKSTGSPSQPMISYENFAPPQKNLDHYHVLNAFHQFVLSYYDAV